MSAVRKPAKSKKISLPALSSYCAIVPSTLPVLDEDSFGISDSSVLCIDSRAETKRQYAYQKVFNGPKEFQSSFETSYLPYVKQALSGESVLFAFSGIPTTEPSEHFCARNGKDGFLNRVTTHVIKACTKEAHRNSIVTLSWFKVGSHGAESITDLLRASSALQTASTRTDPNLVLRELGHGRGMTLPGLWEVEMTNPNDVTDIISHVQKVLPSSHHDGTDHSIFQITISPRSRTTKSAMLEDASGVGRITIALLSNIGPICNANYVYPAEGRYPWADLAVEILQWIENARPSPPYHKSRILLILRDALCGRMSCAWTLFLQPAVEHLPDNNIWLDITSRIARISNSRTNAPTETRPLSPSKAPFSMPTVLENTTRLDTESVQSGSDDNSPQLKAAQRNHRSRLSNNRINGNAEPEKPNLRMIAQEDLSKSISALRGMVASTPSVSFATHTTDYPDTSFHTSHLSSPPPPPPPSFGPAGSRRAASDITPGPLDLLPRPSAPFNFSDMSRRTPPNLPSRVGEFKNSGNEQHSNHSKPSSVDTFTMTEQSGETPVLDHEGMLAMLRALEASRDEVEYLKEASFQEKQRSEQLSQELEALRNQRLEEGHTLKEKERIRYRKALQDLKDYEVYREVMEAAMAKMQAAMEHLEKENQTLRGVEATLEKDLRRAKSASLKTAKETDQTRKIRDDLKQKITTLEQTLAKVSKEKDAAIAAVSLAKTDKMRIQSEHQATLDARKGEIIALKKSLKAAEAKIAAHDSDVNAIVAKHEKEVEKLRAAHTKALEMLMSYQEENDLLRSAMADMIEESGALPPPDAPPDVPPDTPPAPNSGEKSKASSILSTASST